MSELGKYDLPTGWRWSTIPELVGKDGVFIDGDWVESKDQDPDGDVRLIQLADVGDGVYRDKSDRFMTVGKAEELRCTFLKKDDVLIARMPDPLGRACVFPGDDKPSVTVVDVAIARSGNGEFDHRWLANFVNAQPFRAAISGLQAGSTRKRISRGNLGTIPLPVPPLKEQRRIVAEIERHFTRLNVGVAALRRTQANLKRYRAAVLNAAREGKLVPASGSVWKSQLLNDLVVTGRSIGYGVLKPGPHVPNGVRLLKSGQVRNGALDLSDDFRISQELDEEFRRTRLQGGEVLLNLVGASIGRSAVVPPELRGANVSRAIAVIPVHEKSAKWIQLILSSSTTQSQMMGHRVGNAQPVLNLSHVRRLPIPIPPPAEQALIVAEVERRLSVVVELEAVVAANLQRATCLRKSLLQTAFTGNLVPQNPSDEPAEQMLERIRNQQDHVAKAHPRNRGSKSPAKEREVSAMRTLQDPKAALESVLSHKSEAVTADALFRAGNFERAQAYVFYDAIADSPEAIKRLAAGRQIAKTKPISRRKSRKPRMPLRLHELWVKRFKNLENYLVTFDPEHALDVLLGWNGTGKSNLFEVLIAIFRDLHKWQTKDNWTPQEGLDGYRIRYEIDGRLVEIEWDIHSRRPVATVAEQHRGKISQSEFQKCKREDIPLPHFVFGYYSGPSNRFSELFSEPKQDHYDRLLKEKSDDQATLTRLLEQRRFFNAETHHAKYALLSFFYQDDPAIRGFLKKHLRIEGLESVLFVLKRPRWYRNNNPEDFWGADGLLRPVLERLRRHSIGHMVLPQSVDDGFQESTRDHFFLLLPDKEHLQALASEYADPTSFFVALESTDFSSIIHEVRIRVRISATAGKQTVITFKEMSEGEQQLLMVLGLLRFTKMNQSLVLLDEPDTHLNPHWQLGYLHLLLEALVGTASDRKSSTRLPIEELEKRLTSQVLLSTHDPLAIAGLVKENIHLLKRRDYTEECLAVTPTENPRGMGFTGILTSEMFGLKSDLDEETLSLLDQHAELVGRKTLTTVEKKKLREMTDEVERLGFKSTSSDPYYRAFLQALARRRNARDLLAKATWTKEDIKYLGKETDEILKEIEKEDRKK